jgi:hypothetical protein
MSSFLGSSACVEINRGAIVQMNFQALDSNVPGEHYELFATVNGGAVSLGRFKVLDAIDNTLFPPADGRPREHCAGNPLTTSNVQLIQRWEVDYDAVARCDPDARMGTVDKFADGLRPILAGGVRLDTRVDLSDADGLFITLEPDTDLDPRPGASVLRAAVARGVDPLTCAQAEPRPPRRGVLLGTFVAVDDSNDCPFAKGRVAIVPAEDETVL